MSAYNFNAAEGHQSTTCPPQAALGQVVEGRMHVPATSCLIKPHLRFDPDHHHHHQQSSGSSGRLAHFSTNSSSNSTTTMYTDDLYSLEPLYPHQQPAPQHQQAQQQPQQPQQQQQQHFTHQQQLHQQWIATDFVPVQRQVPSTRAYSYQPYPTSSPRISHYVSPVSATLTQSQSAWDYPLLDYPSFPTMYDGLCSPATPLDTTLPFGSHGLYNSYGYGNCYNNLYQQQQPQPQPQQPTCIAPEDLFARMPMTPISPASASVEESSDDRASTPSSADTAESARSSPTRPGLQIPTVPSLSLSTSSIAPSLSLWTSSSSSQSQTSLSLSSLSSSSSSSLPSPVDSLSSVSSSDEPAFIPTPSLKKSAAAATSTLKAKRATRSAAPEPAWVEAVLAEDAKRLQMDAHTHSASPTSANTPRPANRPIAFACVFCRHRKIQCIRPKTEVGPGEKPAPCNQCEKRNRCCEYPPAALNPRIGRRTRPGKNED